MLSFYDFFWEIWILKCPETQKTFFKIFSAINIEFSIGYCNQIRVSLVYINAWNLSFLSHIKFKFKQML